MMQKPMSNIDDCDSTSQDGERFGFARPLRVRLS